MSAPAQIRQKMAELAEKRARLEKQISDANMRRSKKESEAVGRGEAAERASSSSNRNAYLKQAQSARQESVRESQKIAELSRKLAAISREESERQKALISAEKAEIEAVRRTDQKIAQERQRDQRRAEDARRKAEREAKAARIKDDSWRRRSDSSIRQLERFVHELRQPREEALRILYATASTAGDLRVDEEIRRVKAVVRSSTHRERVEIEHLPAATAGDLLDCLTSMRPHVVHFSGHGSERVLAFDDGSDVRGGGNIVAARAFKAAVEAPDEAPMLVVLNSCKSAEQLEQLIGRVPMAIGMADSIGDVDALTFATRFYRSLAEGQSVQASLATARADMLMNGLADFDLPQLVTVAGVDPALVRLVSGVGFARDVPLSTELRVFGQSDS